jgi:hypothetical protein
MINNKLLKSAAAAGGLVPSENFNTVLYSGNQTARSITGLDFTPDLVWIKSRNETNLHVLTDSVRGTNKQLFSNQTDAESTSTNRLTVFDSNGFSIAAGNSLYRINKNNINYVAWCWKAPDAFSHSASGSQLASSGKSNQAAGFSIVSYTGNDTTGATVKHNLGVKPELILFKARGVNNNWGVYASAITADKFLVLNNTDAAGDSSTPFNDTEPDATVITLGTLGSFNRSDSPGMIAYCFASVAGYSKIGTYEGNAGNKHIDCGFEPAFVLAKSIDSTSFSWVIFDNKRNTTNERDCELYPNLDSIEYCIGRGVDFTTTGFQLNSTSYINTNGEDYIFYAVAADPDTTTPTLAKSFNIDTYTGTGGTQQIGSVNTLFTKYAVFNGSSSYIQTGFTLPADSTMSFSFWLKPRAYGSGDTYVLSDLNSSAGDRRLDLRFNSSGNFIIDIGNGSSNNTEVINYTMGASALGAWVHLVVTINGTAVKLYKNGIIAAEQNSSVAFGTAGSRQVTLGRAGDYTGSAHYNGQMDQLRVFTSTLAASDVTTLYNETQSTSSTLDYPASKGCIILYEFNDNADNTGPNYDGTPVNITYDSFLFKPDLVIIKNREQNDGWRWFDTQRGVLNRLESDATSAAADLANSLTAFNNAGFTVGSEATVNTSGEDYVAYSLKMLDNNNNVPIENEVGTIDSLTSVNALAGMSIAKYIGNGTQNATIGHGLTSSPDMVIIKNLDQTDSWFVSHSGLSSNQFMELDNVASATDQNPLNHTRNSTTFQTTGTTPHHMFNASGENYIMYSFITTSTFSHFGSYDGDNGTDRLFNIGFAADFVMVKKSNGNSNWQTFDSIRGGNAQIDFNSDAVEYTGGSTPIEFVSNGFKIKSNYTTYNATGGEYIYWAMKIN